MKLGVDEFEEGFVQLRKGKHIGPNKGFGVEHIWAEHSYELKQLGYNSEEEVSKFVADLIKTNAPIYCEFNNPRGNHRIAVVKATIGIAYLERRTTGDNSIVYSVVTAFTKGKAHGTKIGTVG